MKIAILKEMIQEETGKRAGWVAEVYDGVELVDVITGKGWQIIKTKSVVALHHPGVEMKYSDEAFCVNYLGV